MENKFNGTQWPWVYDSDRDTHDFIVYTKGAEDKIDGSRQIPDEYGVIGSSEWIWMEEADIRLVTKAPEMFQLLHDIHPYLQALETGIKFFKTDPEFIKIKESLKTIVDYVTPEETSIEEDF